MDCQRFVDTARDTGFLDIDTSTLVGTDFLQRSFHELGILPVSDKAISKAYIQRLDKKRKRSKDDPGDVLEADGGNRARKRAGNY
jgi:hypothetical protein